VGVASCAVVLVAHKLRRFFRQRATRAGRSSTASGPPGEPIRIDEHLMSAWPAYQLWVEGKVSLDALYNGTLTVDDIADAHHVWEEYEAARLRSQRKSGG
jgi:hypothetical protein